MPEWLDDAGRQYATTVARGLGVLTLALVGFLVVAAVAWVWGPELAERFSSSLR